MLLKTVRLFGNNLLLEIVQSVMWQNAQLWAVYKVLKELYKPTVAVI